MALLIIHDSLCIGLSQEVSSLKVKRQAVGISAQSLLPSCYDLHRLTPFDSHASLLLVVLSWQRSSLMAKPSESIELI